MNKKIIAFFTIMLAAVYAFSLEKLNVGGYEHSSSKVHFHFDCYDDNTLRMTDDTKVQIVVRFNDLKSMLKASLTFEEFAELGGIDSVKRMILFFETAKIPYDYKKMPGSKDYYVEVNAEDLVKASAKSEDSKKLVVWSFTDELQAMIENYYMKDYPEVEIDYSLMPTDQFPNKLDPVLARGYGAPDVFALEDSFVRKYVEQGDELLLDLTDEYNAIKDKMIPYPAEVATYNGRVYAVSWQTAAGGMFYRRSLAKKYLGTDDPKEVQKYVKDWNTFLATARKLNKNSNGRCVMVSSLGDLSKPYLASRKNPWVVNDKLNIDPAMVEYMKMCKTMKDEGLEGGVWQWSEGWFAGMKGELRNYDGRRMEVFSYFLPTWGLHYTLKPNSGDTYGDWAMCQGPVAYRWGGTWIAAYKGTKNPDLAKQFLFYIGTGDKFQEKWAKDTGDVVSNNNVINKIKSGYYDSFLKGQNHYAAFAEMANKVNGKLTQSTDQYIESYFEEATAAYVNGNRTLEQALAEFKKHIAEELGF